MIARIPARMRPKEAPMFRRLVVAVAAIAATAGASLLVPDLAQARGGGNGGVHGGGGGGGGGSHAVFHSGGGGGGGALHLGRSGIHSQPHHVTHSSSLKKSLHKSSLNKSTNKSSLNKSNKSSLNKSTNKSSLNKSTNKSDKSLNKSALNKSLLHNALWTHHHHFFGRRVFVVWFGPIFWPYAFYDLFDDVFWVCDDYYYYSYGCYDRYGPFWAYGYDDLFGGVYWPYLYGGDYRGYASGGRDRRSRLARHGPQDPAPRGARADELAQLCGGEAASLVHFPFDRIEQRVQPTDTQRASFEELKRTAANAADKLKASCPTEPGLGPLGRLDTAEQRLDAMLDAVNSMRGALVKFYDSLDDQQKARFDAIGLEPRREASRSPRGGRQSQAAMVPRVCAEDGKHVAQLSVEEIDRNVRPTDAQRPVLEDLRNASARAAETIKASCPSQTPLTAVARMEAVEKRLSAMLDAIKTVRAPLEKFYDSLSDEQRQRFNRMDRAERRTG